MARIASRYFHVGVFTWVAPHRDPCNIAGRELDPPPVKPLTDEELLQVTTECGKTAQQRELLSRLVAEVRRLRQAVRYRDHLLDRALEALKRTLP